MRLPANRSGSRRNCVSRDYCLLRKIVPALFGACDAAAFWHPVGVSKWERLETTRPDPHPVRDFFIQDLIDYASTEWLPTQAHKNARIFREELGVLSAGLHKLALFAPLAATRGRIE
jgi:hypothetical protein